MKPVQEKYFVYILTTKNRRMFYTGFTDDIQRRTFEHKNFVYEGFTAKYKIIRLVYYEEHNDADTALHREFLIKRYKREWKINLINSLNPNWDDLYYSIT
jgi:putative endonuclease